MTNTIDFTPINDGAFYTVEELNALFRAAALVINAKLDAAVGQERQRVLVGEDIVRVGLDPVLLQLLTEAELDGHVHLNYQPVRNLREGTDAGDAITVAQAKAILGVV